MSFNYPAYRTAAFLSRSLPSSFSYWLASRFAEGFFLMSPRQRAAVGRNHQRIQAYLKTPPAGPSARKQTRETYRLFGKYLVDFFRYSVSDKHGLENRVTMEGEEYLTEALACGRGVLLATAHVGNWELGGLILALRGYPLTVAYRPMSSPRVNRMFLEQRQHRGLDPVPLGRAAISLVRALRKGRIAAVLADRDFSENPFPTPFFGAPARLPRGPATLSFRTGAPLLPGFMLRQPNGNFRLVFFPKIDPKQFDSIEAVQVELVHSLETVIGENPTQWFVFDDFWSDGRTSSLQTKRERAYG